MVATLIGGALGFFRDLFEKRAIILQLARRDFQNRYTGSSLGFAWTLFQPLVMVLILWFVFGVAMGARDIRGLPFAAYVLAGMAAWSFFSEAMLLGTNVFLEYAFLVKKVNFRIAMLPVVKLLSSLAVHVIFLGLVAGLLILLGVRPTLCWLQVFYYLAGLFLLLLGLCWITSSLVVFVRDIGHLIGILLQFGFWLTPIVWDLGMLPPRYSRYAAVLRLNPMYYVVDGYRRSLLEGRWFWEDGRGALAFWTITAGLLLAGALVFRRLKPHFADVL
jgi:lipopolysaccharide transport system permease protein/teichoic acid transport system permease protein